MDRPREGARGGRGGRGRIRAFWCRVPSRPNFGDALTPWLVRRVTGHPPVFVTPDAPGPYYLVTGSIIASAGAGATVWGAGIMSRADPVSPRATLRAVRGPLTRARALECGAECPEILGDPALLLPRLHRPPARPRRGVGVAPHFSDLPRVAAGWRDTDELRLIDLQAPVEQVIDAIASCEVVASSSLHGIIATHAYGAPATWIKWRDLPSGDDTKFRDYFLSVGRSPPAPLRIGCEGIDPQAIARHATPPGEIDLEALWRACPFGAAT